MKQIKRACSLLLTLALLCALTIPALAGTGFINGSTGTFVNHSGATFNNQGAFDNQGTVTNSGSFSNSGTLLDNGTWSGTVPSGKTSGAAITGLGANWVNSNNSFSFYAISFGKDNSFNETALKLEFKASTDSTDSAVLTLYSTKDSTNGSWFSPSINVVTDSTVWTDLVNSATQVTVSALDTSDSSGTVVLSTVAPITVPFAAQDIEQTLSFTAADTSADATTATILTSFGNTLQGGATGTITYSGSGVDQIESQSIIANYSASTSYDHTYTLSNSDMIAAAKNGTLSVYATASYGTATRDSSTKKLTLTYTTYTGSTTASAYGGGSGASGILYVQSVKTGDDGATTVLGQMDGGTADTYTVTNSSIISTGFAEGNLFLVYYDSAGVINAVDMSASPKSTQVREGFTQGEKTLKTVEGPMVYYMVNSETKIYKIVLTGTGNVGTVSPVSALPTLESGRAVHILSELAENGENVATAVYYVTIEPGT